MESHEEKLHKMIIQSKINDTKDIMKKKALDIDKNKMEQKKVGLSSALSGFGSKASAALMPDMEPTPAPYRADPVPVARPSTGMAAGSKGPSKGMQLGKAKKANDFLESLAKEGEVVEIDVPKPSGGTAAVTANFSGDPVTLAIDEKLTVTLNKQGGVENVEVQGTMSLVVNQDEDAFIRVIVQSGANKGFQFKTHPNIDKNLYSSSNILGLKDPSRPFPTGSELGILKWRMQAKDEALVPISINCWPSVSGGESYVNIEYESTSELDLQNVKIVIPVPGGHSPSVNQVGCTPCPAARGGGGQHACVISARMPYITQHAHTNFGRIGGAPARPDREPAAAVVVAFSIAWNQMQWGLPITHTAACKSPPLVSFRCSCLHVARAKRPPGGTHKRCRHAAR